MVRFSCLIAPIYSHKPKKTTDPSVEAMRKTSADASIIPAPKILDKSTSLELTKAQAGTQISSGVKDATSSVSVEESWKSDMIGDKMIVENDSGVHQTRLIKRSQSLGSGLCHKGMILLENETEEVIDQGIYSDSLDQNRLPRPDGSKDSGISPTSEHEKALQPEFVEARSHSVKKECILSIGDPLHSEKVSPENPHTPFFGEGGYGSGNQSPCSPPMIARSCSFPDMAPNAQTSCRHSYEYLAPHSRSSEDLQALDMTRSKMISETQKMKEQESNDNVPKADCLDEGFSSYNYSALAKDWIISIMDETNFAKNLQGETSTQRSEELPSEDFKMSRIKDWVINLEHYDSLEETNGLPDIDDPVKGYSDDFTSAKVDRKVNPGMEAAKRYISSLSVSATTAHLANHGLEVIPFLSAFGSLRVLNLSGNSIGRITTGALPRGLHALNLSKNNISIIEGLRELTRLRILDLSYNRIFRIGHGLASCSSLKELYLAGNKISEVEGLHRLLKLTVLDLIFNKISTAKCLGQLAANYNSLQAISLEGNPAQKNVGDEQLKKYLQGLLPHLIYFNRHAIKSSTLKDAADRSVRLAISERGFRSDNKAARKASHVPTSTHARKSHAVVSPKTSRGKHVRPPPGGPKATTGQRHHYMDLGSKLLNFKSELSLHKSRSAGTLRAV